MANSENLLQQLHKQLLAHFNQEELSLVCFYLGLAYDDLPGEARPKKAYELILLVARQGRLPQLLQILREERPSVDWPDIPSDFQPPAPIDTITASGSTFQIDQIQSAAVNVGGVQYIEHLEVNMGGESAAPSPPTQVPPELAELVARLQQALVQVPSPYVADGQKVAKRLEVLTKEMNKPTVDKEMLQMYAQSLARSTDKLTEIQPQVAAITNKIIEAIVNWSA